MEAGDALGGSWGEKMVRLRGEVALNVGKAGGAWKGFGW